MQARLLDKTLLDDLAGNSDSGSCLTVRLGHGERHQRGPTPGAANSSTDDNFHQSYEVVRKELSQWSPSGRTVGVTDYLILVWALKEREVGRL